VVGDPDYGARLVAEVDARLRLLRAGVAEHARAIAWVEAALAEAERRARRRPAARSPVVGPDAAPLRLALYLWLAVVAAWMVAACEALLMLPR